MQATLSITGQPLRLVTHDQRLMLPPQFIAIAAAELAQTPASDREPAHVQGMLQFIKNKLPVITARLRRCKIAGNVIQPRLGIVVL